MRQGSGPGSRETAGGGLTGADVDGGVGWHWGARAPTPLVNPERRREGTPAPSTGAWEQGRWASGAPSGETKNQRPVSTSVLLTS